MLATANLNQLATGVTVTTGGPAEGAAGAGGGAAGGSGRGGRRGGRQ